MILKDLKTNSQILSNMSKDSIPNMQRNKNKINQDFKKENV